MQQYLFSRCLEGVQQHDIQGLEPRSKEVLGIPLVFAALQGNIKAVDARLGDVLSKLGKRMGNLGQTFRHGFGVFAEVRGHDRVPFGNGTHGAARRHKGGKDGLEHIGFLTNGID